MSDSNARLQFDGPDRPRLRFMTCGSVDDGKSTLIGRLLIESGAVFEDHLIEARRASGGEMDFSFLVDGLKAEREQGITIDVAYRYFATGKRAFIVADAPGHEQYTRNQAAAASQVQLAVVLVSAREGVQPQTLRHMAIVSLFGVREIIIAVNKMDLVDYKREPFSDVLAVLNAHARGVGLTVRASIPISAKHGDNVVHPGQSMAWYGGPTLIELLETFEPGADSTGDMVLPIAYTGRIDDGGRVSFGELSGGSLAVGQSVKTETGLVARVEQLWVAGVQAKAASLNDAVAVQLNPELDLGRGSVLGDIDKPLAHAKTVRARLIWLDAVPPVRGRPYQMQVGTAQTAVSFGRIEGVLDLQSNALLSSEHGLRQNDIFVGALNCLTGVPVTRFADNKVLGSVIVVDRVTKQTVAAGVILSVERRSNDTPWQISSVKPADRARSIGQVPFVIWLTGLSGSGKSTLADMLDRRLMATGYHSVVLDGDNLRNGLNADLGFSVEDRRENIRRTGHVAALMADAGLIVIASLISPFKSDRAAARDVIGSDRYLEVFVDAPLDVCLQRDVKGMYARARAGDLPGFTGIAGDYEAPEAPDLHLRTDRLSAEEAVTLLMASLRDRGVVS